MLWPDSKTSGKTASKTKKFAFAVDNTAIKPYGNTRTQKFLPQNHEETVSRIRFVSLRRNFFVLLLTLVFAIRKLILLAWDFWTFCLNSCCWPSQGNAREFEGTFWKYRLTCRNANRTILTMSAETTELRWNKRGEHREIWVDAESADRR